VNQARRRVLWGISGSVATIRADRLAAELLKIGEVQAVVTRRGRHFLNPLPDSILVHDDESEWAVWSKLGDPVLHIELRRWADVLVIAPLTADALAKTANGICDTLLLSVARAWDFSKPMILAPAMNTFMWEHPTTAEHLRRVREWGVRVVDPVEKELACSDVGMGGMAPADVVAAVVLAAVGDSERPADHSFP
jgi:phosphopantothenoylcysteine decarboxylase